MAAALAVFLFVLLRSELAADRSSRPGELAVAQPVHAKPVPTPATSSAPASSQATPGTAATSSAPANPQAAASSVTTAPNYAARLRGLVRRYSRGSVSVAAYDVDTGHMITAGAGRGMITASLVKVELLETLLLRHQGSGTPLSDTERAACAEMIENSDNGAADSIYRDVDAGVGLVGAERRLGLSPARTKPRGDDFWGLSTTSASEQIALLKNLVLPSSPLRAASRQFALHLMENVEADQRWGVPSVADKASTYAVKNGWLAIDDDDDLWAVSSDGVVQISGHTVLISVMTQHDGSMSDGVELVERLVRAAADALSQGNLP